jgi:hypothetical protein
MNCDAQGQEGDDYEETSTNSSEQDVMSMTAEHKHEAQTVGGLARKCLRKSSHGHPVTL